MNRGVWFAAGSALGAYAVLRARRAAEVFTYDGLHDRLSGLFVGARLFGEEVRRGAEDKETELRERLSLLPHGRSAIEGQPTLHLVAGTEQAAEADRVLDPRRGNDD
jgi:Family of unknown function (DUF6167)